jgi:hypothetical protein
MSRNRIMERNPNHGKFVRPDGYIDLGWQLYSGNSQEVKACVDAGHNTKEFDNSLHRFRCTDVITICDECKTIHHTDMSD